MIKRDRPNASPPYQPQLPPLHSQLSILLRGILYSAPDSMLTSRNLILKKLEERMGMSLAPYKAWLTQEILAVLNEIRADNFHFDAANITDPAPSTDGTLEAVSALCRPHDPILYYYTASPLLRALLTATHSTRGAALDMLWSYVTAHSLYCQYTGLIALDAALQRLVHATPLVSGSSLLTRIPAVMLAPVVDAHLFDTATPQQAQSAHARMMARLFAHVLVGKMSTRTGNCACTGLCACALPPHLRTAAGIVSESVCGPALAVPAHPIIAMPPAPATALAQHSAFPALSPEAGAQMAHVLWRQHVDMREVDEDKEKEEEEEEEEEEEKEDGSVVREDSRMSLGPTIYFPGRQRLRGSAAARWARANNAYATAVSLLHRPNDPQVAGRPASHSADLQQSAVSRVMALAQGAGAQRTHAVAAEALVGSIATSHGSVRATGCAVAGELVEVALAHAEACAGQDTASAYVPASPMHGSADAAPCDVLAGAAGAEDVQWAELILRYSELQDRDRARAEAEKALRAPDATTSPASAVADSLFERVARKAQLLDASATERSLLQRSMHDDTLDTSLAAVDVTRMARAAAAGAVSGVQGLSSLSWLSHLDDTLDVTALDLSSLDGVTARYMSDAEDAGVLDSSLMDAIDFDNHPHTHAHVDSTGTASVAPEQAVTLAALLQPRPAPPPPPVPAPTVSALQKKDRDEDEEKEDSRLNSSRSAQRTLPHLPAELVAVEEGALQLAREDVRAKLLQLLRDKAARQNAKKTRRGSRGAARADADADADPEADAQSAEDKWLAPRCKRLLTLLHAVKGGDAVTEERVNACLGKRRAVQVQALCDRVRAREHTAEELEALAAEEARQALVDKEITRRQDEMRRRVREEVLRVREEEQMRALAARAERAQRKREEAERKLTAQERRLQRVQRQTQEQQEAEREKRARREELAALAQRVREEKQLQREAKAAAREAARARKAAEREAQRRKDAKTRAKETARAQEANTTIVVADTDEEQANGREAPVDADTSVEVGSDSDGDSSSDVDASHTRSAPRRQPRATTVATRDAAKKTAPAVTASAPAPHTRATAVTRRAQLRQPQAMAAATAKHTSADAEAVSQAAEPDDSDDGLFSSEEEGGDESEGSNGSVQRGPATPTRGVDAESPNPAAITVADPVAASTSPAASVPHTHLSPVRVSARRTRARSPVVVLSVDSFEGFDSAEFAAFDDFSAHVASTAPLQTNRVDSRTEAIVEAVAAADAVAIDVVDADTVESDTAHTDAAGSDAVDSDATELSASTAPPSPAKPPMRRVTTRAAARGELMSPPGTTRITRSRRLSATLADAHSHARGTGTVESPAVDAEAVKPRSKRVAAQVARQSLSQTTPPISPRLSTPAATTPTPTPPVSVPVLDLDTQPLPDSQSDGFDDSLLMSLPMEYAQGAASFVYADTQGYPYGQRGKDRFAVNDDSFFGGLDSLSPLASPVRAHAQARAQTDADDAADGALVSSQWGGEPTHWLSSQAAAMAQTRVSGTQTQTLTSAAADVDVDVLLDESVWRAAPARGQDVGLTDLETSLHAVEPSQTAKTSGQVSVLAASAEALLTSHRKRGAADTLERFTKAPRRAAADNATALGRGARTRTRSAAAAFSEAAIRAGERELADFDARIERLKRNASDKDMSKDAEVLSFLQQLE